MVLGSIPDGIRDQLEVRSAVPLRHASTIKELPKKLGVAQLLLELAERCSTLCSVALVDKHVWFLMAHRGVDLSKAIV